MSSPSGVRGRAPAENGFWRILKATKRSFLYLYDKIWGGAPCIIVPRFKFWGGTCPPVLPVIYAHDYYPQPPVVVLGQKDDPYYRPAYCTKSESTYSHSSRKLEIAQGFNRHQLPWTMTVILHWFSASVHCVCWLNCKFLCLPAVHSVHGTHTALNQIESKRKIDSRLKIDSN